MFTSRFVGPAVAAVALLVQFVAADDSGPCSNPSVRREWRDLPAQERADWMAAVKVRYPPTFDSRRRMTDTSTTVPEQLAS